MTPAKLIRWSGIASALGGLWMIVVALFGLGQEGQTWVFAVSTALMIFALFGIYAVQINESGLWGLAGFVGAVTSEILMMVEGDPEQPLGMLAGALYAMGLFALIVGTWRGRVFSRWIPGLWLAAIIIGLPAYAISSLGPILLLTATLAFGLGFIMAGYELWTQRAVKGNPRVDYAPGR